MGCGCKGGKAQVINNVYNTNVITYAKEIYERVVLPNTTGEYSDIDKIEIMEAYSSIYPSSSQTPSLEDAINQIKIGIELYGIKKKSRTTKK